MLFFAMGNNTLGNCRGYWEGWGFHNKTINVWEIYGIQI